MDAYIEMFDSEAREDICLQNIHIHLIIGIIQKMKRRPINLVLFARQKKK